MALKLDTEFGRTRSRRRTRIVAQHGIRRLSIAAVARRVGVVPSALYRHFENKDAMIETVMGLVRERLLENVRAVTLAVSDPFEQLRLLLAQVQVAEARLARVRVESLVQQARGALNTAMGLPVATPIEADVQEAPLAPPDAIDVSGALAQALADRSSIEAAVQRALAATEAVSAAQSA